MNQTKMNKTTMNKAKMNKTKMNETATEEELDPKSKNTRETTLLSKPRNPSPGILRVPSVTPLVSKTPINLFHRSSPDRQLLRCSSNPHGTPTKEESDLISYSIRATIL